MKMGFVKSVGRIAIHLRVDWLVPSLIAACALLLVLLVGLVILDLKAQIDRSSAVSHLARAYERHTAVCQR